MGGNEKRKQSLYFPEDVLQEISKEAIRLDRSLSWVVQQAWRIAHAEVAKFPAVNLTAGAPEPKSGEPRPASETQRPPAEEHEPAPAAERQPGSQVRDFISGKFDRP